MTGKSWADSVSAREAVSIDIFHASESIAEMIADWYGNAPLPNARITSDVIAIRLARFVAAPVAPQALTEDIAGLVERLTGEATAMHAAVDGEQIGESFHVRNWADKPHRVIYDACALLRQAATALASLVADQSWQREHIRKQADDIATLGKLVYASETETWQSKFESAERKLEEQRKALKAAYEECAQIAEIDMRSPTAKSTGHKPEWYKHGLSIAKRIRNAAARALTSGAAE